jgi:ketosteroid isomerase-like protein
MIGAIIAKKAITASFDAMNRHNLSEFMSAWREDAVFIYPGDIHASGTFHRKDAIESRINAFF